MSGLGRGDCHGCTLSRTLVLSSCGGGPGTKAGEVAFLPFPLYLSLQQTSKIRGNCFGFDVQLVPGEVDDGEAGGVEDAAASAVVLEGRARGVSLPAVELDDQAQVRPVAIDLVALGAEEDPVVEAGKGQMVPAEEWSEAFLELRALAPRWLLLQPLESELDLPRPSFPRIALQKVR